MFLTEAGGTGEYGEREAKEAQGGVYMLKCTQLRQKVFSPE